MRNSGSTHALDVDVAVEPPFFSYESHYLYAS